MSAKSDKKRIFLYAGLLGLAVIVAGARFVMTMETGQTWTEAPPETHGVWTTDDPRYKGRAIEVGPTSVTLRVDEAGTPLPGELIIARELFEDDQRILRLEYETQGGADALDMVVSQAGSMFLFNQPDLIWSVDPTTMPTPVAPVVVAPDPTGGPSSFPFGIVAIALALLGAAAGVVLLLGSASGGGQPVAGGKAPSMALGVWSTPDPKYEGRTIRIAKGYAYAHFGPGPIRRGGLIESVKQAREDGARLITMILNRQDGDETLEMLIDRDGLMRLRGGRSVWVRRDG